MGHVTININEQDQNTSFYNNMNIQRSHVMFSWPSLFRYVPIQSYSLKCLAVFCCRFSVPGRFAHGEHELRDDPEAKDGVSNLR